MVAIFQVDFVTGGLVNTLNTGLEELRVFFYNIKLFSLKIFLCLKMCREFVGKSC